MERRVAFVTGASRGIGKAASLALAEKGFDLVLTARTLVEGEVREYSPLAGRSLRRAMPGSLEVTAREVRERGREALAIRLDLLERDSIESALEEALAHFGRVDLLLNNGIYQGPGLLDRVLSLDLHHLEKLMQGNVLAPLILVQRLLPGMLEQGRGWIVNMVSAAGMSDPPAPGDAGGWGFGYAASKAAFLRMAGVLAVEHADCGVRFHNVEPGMIVTESMRAQGLTEELARRFRGAPPEVPAAVIAWLASDPAAEAWQGRTVHAQRLCRELGLLPGWSPSP